MIRVVILLLVILFSVPAEGQMIVRRAAAGGCSDVSADSDLHGWWRMEETAATGRADGSGEGNTVGPIGTVSQDTTNFQQGSASASIDTSGGDYLTIGNSNLSSGFPTQTSSAAVSFGGWVRTPASFTNAVIMDRAGDIRIGFISSSMTGVVGTSSGDSTVTSNSTLSTSTWYFVMITWDGTTVKMRLDGVDQTDTETNTGTLNTANTAFRFFRTSSGGAAACTGCNVDEFSVWSTNITDEVSDCIKDEGVDAGGLP